MLHKVLGGVEMAASCAEQHWPGCSPADREPAKCRYRVTLSVSRGFVGHRKAVILFHKKLRDSPKVVICPQSQERVQGEAGRREIPAVQTPCGWKLAGNTSWYCQRAVMEAQYISVESLSFHLSDGGWGKGRQLFHDRQRWRVYQRSRWSCSSKTLFKYETTLHVT